MDYSYLDGCELVSGLQKWLSQKFAYRESGMSLILNGKRRLQWEHALILSSLSDKPPEFYMALPSDYRQRAIHFHLKEAFIKQVKKETEHGNNIDQSDGSGDCRTGQKDIYK